MEKMESLQDLWTHFLSSLLQKELVSEDSFRLWLENLELRELTSSEAKIFVPQPFKINILKELYTELLERNFSAFLGFPVKAQFFPAGISRKPLKILDRACGVLAANSPRRYLKAKNRSHFGNGKR